MDITVKDISIEQTRAQIACMLNELWHSKLPNIHWSNVVRNKHYICYVFKYKQAIIGVGIWSSPVAANRFKDGDKLLELRRLALSDVCPRNTASFVISTMIKDISDDNFKDVNGKWFKRGYDQALMLPLLSKTDKRLFLDKVCYQYNINSVSIKNRSWEEREQISTINVVRSRGFLR